MLLVGAPGTEFRLAADMAREAGTPVRMADAPADALALLREGGFRLVMIDVAADIPGFMAAMRAARLDVPVLACGIDAPADLAVAAIRAGARDYVPLPPQADLIAAAIAAADASAFVPEVETLVGRTVDDVERALILQTLARCGGNRTGAATVLGISVRTMRNKLRAFVEAGIPVAPAV